MLNIVIDQNKLKIKLPKLTLEFPLRKRALILLILSIHTILFTEIINKILIELIGWKKKFKIL